MRRTRTLPSSIRLFGLVLCGLLLSACSPPEDRYYVTAESLNVRDAPEIGTVVDILSRGESVRVVHQQAGWAQLESTDGRTGSRWVSMDYLASQTHFSVFLNNLLTFEAKAILPLIIIFVLFYFLFIRPRRKKQKLLGKVTDVGPDKDAGKNYTSLRNYSSLRGDSGNIELFCSRCRRGTTHSFFKKDSDNGGWGCGIEIFLLAITIIVIVILASGESEVVAPLVIIIALFGTLMFATLGEAGSEMFGVLNFVLAITIISIVIYLTYKSFVISRDTYHLQCTKCGYESIKREPLASFWILLRVFWILLFLIVALVIVVDLTP